MDDIKTRLGETSEACLKAYEAWKNNPKDVDARENLQERIHDLRKVSSRLEIEIAMSERDQMASKPLPIPSHRSHKRGQAEISDMDADNATETVTIKKKTRRAPRKAKTEGENN